MACDEQAEAIYEVIEALAAEGIVTNMDEVEKEFSANSELNDLNLTRADIARAIVEVEAWKASQTVRKAISNLAEIKGEARIEDKLRDKIAALQSELGTIPIDSPVGPQKRKRINSTIESLRKQLEQELQKRGLDKKYERRIKELNKSIANLDSQINDLELGIDITREKRTPKEEAEEIERLKKTRDERTRERNLLEQINRHYKGEAVEEKEEPEKAPVSQRISDLMEQRDEARRRRQLLDQIKKLKQQLQAGEFEIPMTKKAKEESEEVETLKNQRDLLKKQIASAARSLERKPGTARWWSENVMGAYKTSRASIDWSMVLRQGYKPLLGRPIRWGISKFMTTAKATLSEEYFQDKFKQIINSPEYFIMVKGKLELTDPDGMMGNREDAFAQTGWLESSKLTNALLVGKGVRMSNRAYTHYLNEVRVQAYMDIVRSLTIDGNVPETKDLEAIGRFVNIITGRGDPGELMKYGEVLNNLMFSYRFSLSQFQFLEEGFRHLATGVTGEEFYMPTDVATLARRKGKRLLGSDPTRKKLMQEYARICTGMAAMSTLGWGWNMAQTLLIPPLGEGDEEEIRKAVGGIFPQDGKGPRQFKTDKEIKELADAILKSNTFQPHRFNNENDKKYRIRREKAALKVAQFLAGKVPGQAETKGIDPATGKRVAVGNNVTTDKVVAAIEEYIRSENTTDINPAHENGIPLYWDPRSSEFQKWRIGDRRVDLMGGYGQAIRLVSQFWPEKWGGGKITINKKGEIKRTGQWDLHTGPSTIGMFLTNKVHPLVSAGVEYTTGKQAFTDRPTRRVDAEGIRAWEPNWEWVADDFIPFWNSLFIQEARETIGFEGMEKGDWEAVGILIAASFLGGGSYRMGDDRSGEEGTYLTDPKREKEPELPEGGTPPFKN